MDDLRNGFILLRVIDRLRPGTVDWKKRYSDKLHSRIHIVQNCNYVLEICNEKMNIVLVGIGGVDIVDGNVTLTLGLVWQLCKVYWEERVGKTNEAELMNWANERVPNEHKIKSMKDPSIANCQFLLHVIESIKPSTVDFSKLKEATNDENTISNINYTIACARKLGAEIITLWEHIKESNARYVAIMLAELQHIEKKKNWFQREYIINNEIIMEIYIFYITYPYANKKAANDERTNLEKKWSKGPEKRLPFQHLLG